MNQDLFNQIMLNVGQIIELFLINNDFKQNIKVIDMQIEEFRKKRFIEPQNIDEINKYITYFEKVKRIYIAIDTAQTTNNLNMN